MVFSSPPGIQHFVIFAAQPYGLPLKEVTIAQYLKTLGYKTHAVGKVTVQRAAVLQAWSLRLARNKNGCSRKSGEKPKLLWWLLRC